MTKPKLSKTQQEVYDQLLAGEYCHYMRYMGRFNPTPYYFMHGTMRRCTAQVNALLEKGLAERFDVDRFGEHKVRAKPVVLTP